MCGVFQIHKVLRWEERLQFSTPTWAQTPHSQQGSHWKPSLLQNMGKGQALPRLWAPRAAAQTQNCLVVMAEAAAEGGETGWWAGGIICCFFCLFVCLFLPPKQFYFIFCDSFKRADQDLLSEVQWFRACVTAQESFHFDEGSSVPRIIAYEQFYQC